MRRFVLLGFFLYLFLAPCFDLPPPRWFPLDPGSRWTYVQKDSHAREQVVTVWDAGGDESIATVGFNGTEVLIRGFNFDFDLELPGEGFVPFYRFGEKSWLHRDFRSCNDGVALLRSDQLETVETPAGIFDCLRLDYAEGGSCIDAGSLAEWWCADVGLVQWTEMTFAGPRTWVLKSYEHSWDRAFRRGDASGDSACNISDVIFILEWLFTGGLRSTCPDAADANDDGGIDIGDPVAMLVFLFLGGVLPPPGAYECGKDQMSDLLYCLDNADC